MPFYLTNENIEATMERNPDDVFHPSDMNQSPSSRKSSIRRLISQEITDTFEKHIGKPVAGIGQFCKVDSFKEENCLSYLFTFETQDEEYEITYFISLSLATVLEEKSQTHKDTIDANKKILLSLSDSIVNCLNEQDFTYLQDIQLMDLCAQTIDDEKVKNLKNLYSYTVSIDNKEYALYLQLDNQFNKMF